MENQVTDTVLANELRGPYPSHDNDLQSYGEAEGRCDRRDGGVLEALRIPVGTNLADAERWMIFATLDKCGGNKTRAAALLGVSLKTLYNRLNAYRAQGLAMDYEPSTEPNGERNALDGADGPGHAGGIRGEFT